MTQHSDTPAPQVPPREPGSHGQAWSDTSQPASGGGFGGPWPSQVPSGSFPGMPAVGLERPGSIKASFWLMLAAGVLPLLGVPALVSSSIQTLRESFAAAALQTGSDLPPGALEQVEALMVPLIWVSSVVSVGIYVLIAFGIRAGMNWVRIVATVFAGLGIMATVFSFALFAIAGIPLDAAYALYPADPLWYASTLAGSLAFYGSVVAAWLPPSNRYVAARRAAKHGYR
ncbi:hypothetical protein [Sinomonas halotolerans]|uniref:Integral membrane protein n=1 Tax=Sinomonas halotolerans TaxID=1644133 RepID=A0ABU9X1J9_9MICC